MVVEVFEVQDSPSIFIFFSLMNISETNSSDQRSGTFSIAQSPVYYFSNFHWHCIWFHYSRDSAFSSREIYSAYGTKIMCKPFVIVDQLLLNYCGFAASFPLLLTLLSYGSATDGGDVRFTSNGEMVRHHF